MNFVARSEVSLTHERLSRELRDRNERPDLGLYLSCFTKFLSNIDNLNSISYLEYVKINEFFSSFIKIHVLHHSLKQEIFGSWMIEELEEHGYKISPGSMYPLLRNMENKGLLKSREEQTGKVLRKYYRITPQGKKELAEAKIKLKELIGEILD